MSTRHDTPPIGRLLRSKRGNGFKSKAADALGVSRQAYDAWESGHHIPGDEWAETLADYLGLELREVVWYLYQDRIRPLNPRYVKPRGWVGRPKDNRPALAQPA